MYFIKIGNFLVLFLLLVLFAACMTKEHVQPAHVANLFTPHTDTFYGAVYEDDSCKPINQNAPVAWSYIYVCYPSKDSIIFSSSYSNTVEGRYSGSFSGNFNVGSSCYCIYDSYGFTLSGDSLFYNGHQYHCPCDYVINFAGCITHPHQAL